MKTLLFTQKIRTFAILLTVGLLPVACVHDDTDRTSESSGGISFEVGESQTWITDTPDAGRENSPVADIFTLRGPNEADTLFIHTSVSQGIVSDGVDSAKPVSRAAPVTTMYGSFQIWAYAYMDSWAESLLPNLINGDEVKQTNGVWRTAKRYYWPGSGKNVRFFACAPAEAAGMTVSASSGTPTLSYTVPADVAGQTDLLAADKTLAGDTNGPAALPFDHILTAVKFVVGDQMLSGKITEISLKNVSGSGTYRFGADWGNYGPSPTTFTQTLDASFDGTPDTSITKPAATFMMIPQTLPEGAAVEVTFTDNLSGIPRTLTASLHGKVWPRGQTVTYRISTASISVKPSLTVNVTSGDVVYTGGDVTYSVSSSAEVSGQGAETKNVNVPWTAQFSVDGGTTWSSDAPEWLSGFTASGLGGVSSYSTSVSAQTSVKGNLHTKALQETTPVANVNLAAPDGRTENTANCYLVNAPGTYSLPLVYGNAIKNGLENTSAYTSSVSKGSHLGILYNHLKRNITSPYIYKNGDCIPNGALLVWEDAEGLITNVALDESKEHLTFEVPQNAIRQGNAIVAVLKGDVILWSWHIWVTDYKLGTDLDEIRNNKGLQYHTLPVNVGWCDPEGDLYPGRSVLIKITQVLSERGVTPLSTTFRIDQQEHFTTTTIGNQPYYQWGRKDPMCPGILDQNGTPIDKPCFGTFTPTIKSERINIGESIQHPDWFIKDNSYPWSVYSDSYHNLWNINIENNGDFTSPGTKTVYDPSPVGYMVPPEGMWSGFYSGNKLTPEHWDGGWYFYCEPKSTPGDKTTFYPAAGYRDNRDGKAAEVGTTGCYWSSSSKSPDWQLARFLMINRSDLGKPGNTRLRTDGYAIRPVKEQ